MSNGLRLLIFTPTYAGGLRQATIDSIVAQRTSQRVDWEIGRRNPYPGRDMRNVLAQYDHARDIALGGPYDALLTVEQDMILPPHAVEALCNTAAPVVYGTYMLRHGRPTLNAWQYIGEQGLGMSLDRYPAELMALQKSGIGRVSGCGFGCTLIRRAALEAVPFRSDGAGHAPDMPFALDCTRAGILQMARFDVRCGHIYEGGILSVETGGPTVKVVILQAVNILLGGGGVSLVEGQNIELPPRQAQQLAALGYVKVVEDSAGVPKGTKK